MTTATQDRNPPPEQDPDLVDPVDPAEDPTHAPATKSEWSILRWVGMPVFIVAILTATYLWVNSLELDSIERRTLNQDVITQSLMEHLELTLISTVLVMVIAIPLGILVTRPAFKQAVPLVLGLGNAGQAIPSFGFITIIIIWFGIGQTTVIVGLFAYSALPVLRNTMVGLQQVDHSVIKAARGMGMSGSEVLRKVELPLAVPVMLAGIRTALIINVGTATLGTFFAAGGMGYIIFNGIQLNRDPVLISGVVIVSALALTIDYLAGVLGQLASPRGL